MQVFLFDIDGTLIRSGGAGRSALEEAFREEFSLGELPTDIPYCGRTDRAIVAELFTRTLVPDTPENCRRLQASYLARLPRHLAAGAGCVLPGVHELLDQLADRSELGIGLLTGNSRQGAAHKLAHFRLDHHFAFGAYGDDLHDRDDIARSALGVVRDRFRREIAGHRLWVIGDTPYDVRCARAIGAQAVAVATGSFTADELAANQPDLLLTDLSAPAELLRILGS